MHHHLLQPSLRLLLLVTAVLAVDTQAAVPSPKTILWSENFESSQRPSGFSHQAPAAWTIDNSGFRSGEARWAGWAFANMRDWTWAVGTEERHYFTRGSGTMAIVESEHQRLNMTDRLNTHLTTPVIEYTSPAQLEFDSHFRHSALGSEYVSVTLAYDGGAAEEVWRLNESKYSSHEVIPLREGTHKVQISFQYRDGHNAWFWAIDNIDVSRPLPPLSAPADAVIDIISDIQGGDTAPVLGNYAFDNYAKAMSILNAMPDPAAALFINGDFVNLGYQSHYDKFKEVMNASPYHSDRIYFSLGNHEMYGKEGAEAFRNRFLNFTGQEKVWREEVVDGVPNLIIGTEYYSDVDRDGKEPFVLMSDEQLQWLDARLAYWAAQKKPVLLYSHLVLPNTVSMTHSAWYQNDFNDLDAFGAIVSKYNNIIIFTSHSHSSLYQNNWWGLFRYTPDHPGLPVVNTGAILNTYIPDGDHDERIPPERAASGLRVKVYPDRVHVEAWDFIKNKKINEQDFPVPQA